MTTRATGSDLRFESFPTPTTVLGPDDPFPNMEKTAKRRVDPHDEAYREKHFGLRKGYGFGGTRLPYRMQNNFGRQLKPRAFHVAVLENDKLRATFLPELGGRLWSLVHKASGRELLDVNPVIQLTNLGHRSAWFAGGVEWNICPPGYHTPLTCSPMFAGTLRLDDGTPVFRMWEWERIQRVAYQIDAWLPPDADMLRVRIRIVNGRKETIPMYEWSNISVLENPKTRVLAPADQAYVTHYELTGPRISLETMPHFDGHDVSYPTNTFVSRDYFYRIDNRRPWVTALEADGVGLIQTSTSRQVGRKLFVWGMAPGGRRWQEFLSVPGHNYIEIQAGLGRTQQEGVPMPAGATWEWLEAYGMMEADPGMTHNSDWSVAARHVDERLQQQLDPALLEAELEATSAMADRPPETIRQRGSGWGALERHLDEQQSRRERRWSPGLIFDDASLSDEQAPWIELLRTGALPQRDPLEEPGAFQIDPSWRKRLEQSVATAAGNHWLSWFQLGVMRYAASGSDAGARAAWEQSVVLTPNPWAEHGLAKIAWRARAYKQALDHHRRAQSMLPESPRLAAELLKALRETGHAAEAVALFASLPQEARGDRAQLAYVWALLDLGQYAEALARIQNAEEFASMREGEVSLASAWFRAHELRLAETEGIAISRRLRLRVRRELPPPKAIDLRQKPAAPEEDLYFEQREEDRLRRIRRRAAKSSGRDHQ
ncbi:MAG: DUF5107 domain-containing protein [Verrucomicrobia bacterium]|nr:DUF5107 domain-containing protein [Verrucomicrobiota bacterium]